MNRLILSLLLPVTLHSFIQAGESVPLQSEGRRLNSFETKADLSAIRMNSAEISQTSKSVTHGDHALHLRFDPADQWPSVNFTNPNPADYRGYGGLAFDLTNPDDTSLSFGVRIDSSPEADGRGNHSRSGKGTLDGHQRVSFLIPFGVNAADLGMKSLPGEGDYRDLGARGRGPFDLGHVISWQIFLNRPYSPANVIIDNVGLVPGREQDFTGMIDPFGQFSRTDWPGKIRRNQDFEIVREWEKKDLAAHPAPDNRNRFGGWKDGPHLEATGFFRTAQVDGKWSLVDPDGHLFFSVGATSVRPREITRLTGREHFFAFTDADRAFLSEFIIRVGAPHEERIDFLAANLTRKYGPDYATTWLEKTYQRFPSWGFNTLGAFSSWNVFRNGRVPYTAMVWVTGGHARVPGGEGSGRSMHDPFDPVFALDLRRAVNEQARRISGDPWCIGYFVGNEEQWGHFLNGPGSHYSLVIGALGARSEHSPAKQAFLLALKENHTEDIEGLNHVWDTAFTDWEDLEQPWKISPPFSPAQEKELSSLLSLFAQQYFRTVRDLLRELSPNHLYLGARFAGYSPEVIEAAATYCDVLSFNVYNLTLRPKQWEFLQEIPKPVLIGEFHFGATDRGVFDPGLVGVANQEARGDAYQTYIRSVLEHPHFVGAHWFQYTDQPTTGRILDGENGNVGFVSITDTPYPELIEAARMIHRDMYRLRYTP